MSSRRQGIPPAAQRAFATAIGHHQAGRLPDAATFYRRALALHPPYAEAQQNSAARSPISVSPTRRSRAFRRR